MNKYFKRNMETYKFIIEDKLCRSMESIGLGNGDYYINCDSIRIVVSKRIGKRGGNTVNVKTKPTWYEFSEEGLDLIYRNTDMIAKCLSQNREMELSQLDA